MDEVSSSSEQRQITQSERAERAMKTAMGPLLGLFIGIDDYKKELGFPVLTTCANDAFKVRNCFKDVRPLHADRDNLVLLTSQEASGIAIIGALKRLAANATENDRLLLYYSGHGQRLNDKFYLVPHDAYNPNDPESLLAWEKLASIISSSPAKQKLIILDACYSGAAKPNSKILAAALGRGELLKYVAATEGIVTISSSTAERPSTTLSPDSKLSLFTYCLIQGLEGCQSALDPEWMLTSHSLAEFLTHEVPRLAKAQGDEQRPVVNEVANGTIVLGDFSIPVERDSLNLSAHGISVVRAYWRGRVDLKDVLPKNRRLSWKSRDDLQIEANNNLVECEWYNEELAGLSASINNALGCAARNVIVRDNEVSFPGGKVTLEYKVDATKKSGALVKCLVLRDSIFDRPDTMLQIIGAMSGMGDEGPAPVDLIFKKQGRPLDCVDSLRAIQCNLTSQSTEKVTFDLDRRKFEILPKFLRTTGTYPHQFLSNDVDQEVVAALSRILMVVSRTQV